MTTIGHLGVSAYPRAPGVSRDAAWRLAVAISPRLFVRTQLPDATGGFSAQYLGRASLMDEAPAGPWAVHLTDEEGLFHLICFDLDGKSAAAAAQARRDRDQISAWLDRVGIEHVVCASGGVGEGWHIWVSLYEGVAAEVVHAVSDRIKVACSTLDRAPLGNVVTGCVRSPGAPHASGGCSTVVHGDVETLLRASTTRSDLERLAGVVAEEIEAMPVMTRPHEAVLDALPHDLNGRPFLPGDRRPVSAVGRAAIYDECGPDDDASSRLFVTLLCLARSRAVFDDAVNLLEQPGLEHARTQRDPRTGARVVRPRHGPHSVLGVLERQWRKAVAVVATTATRDGDDGSFLARADVVAEAVKAVQTRADAMPGRWTGSCGALDRRVLDVLCLVALQAVTVDVDAGVRMLANLTGAGRESVRTALWRLQHDGWVDRVVETAGTHAATWTIDPSRVIHNILVELRSQAVPRAQRPAPLVATERDLLLADLEPRRAAFAQDLFSAQGLGFEVGNRYARGHSPTAGETDSVWEVLREHGLEAVERGDPLIRDLEERLEVAGILERRRNLYSVEQAMWRWWLDELTRMRESRRRQPTLLEKMGRPLGTTSIWGRHPRRADGRASFRSAREQLLLSA